MGELVCFPSGKSLIAQLNAGGGQLQMVAELIRADPSFDQLDIECRIENGQLAIWQRSLFRGVWRWENGHYCWIPAAYLLPQSRAFSVAEAAKQTVTRLLLAVA